MKAINETNQQILYYARNFLQCRGYNGFSYKDISQKLGIKNAAIHNYYPKKKKI
ncbi:TetR/AcrR family transcriptional regulator [Methanosarcina horonobensis]|uniref:TetR/AcrR family transcriptional regulator n=1 Tax=Methanosarcina horonobensis TaxID=418008 RepID=UPI0022B934C4|nr:TetR/AcrR family transcriptional regulator [Methanosarcina horonobensis]